MPHGEIRAFRVWRTTIPHRRKKQPVVRYLRAIELSKEVIAKPAKEELLTLEASVLKKTKIKAKFVIKGPAKFSLRPATPMHDIGPI